MFLPPIPAQSLPGEKVLVSPDYQDPRVSDRPFAKLGLHIGRIGHHLQLVEPIDQLTVTAFESWGLGPERPLALFDEYAVRPGIFEFDKGVSLSLPIADCKIGTEIAENRKLPREAVR